MLATNLPRAPMNISQTQSTFSATPRTGMTVPGSPRKHSPGNAALYSGALKSGMHYGSPRSLASTSVGSPSAASQNAASPGSLAGTSFAGSPPASPRIGGMRAAGPLGPGSPQSMGSSRRGRGREASPRAARPASPRDGRRAGCMFDTPVSRSPSPGRVRPSSMRRSTEETISPASCRSRPRSPVDTAPRPANSTREKVRSSSPKPVLATEHMKVSDIEDLKTRVLNAEDEGRYLDADAHRDAIRGVKWQHERHLTRVMLDAQRSHLDEVREVHRDEVQEFHANWEAKMTEYEEHIAGVRQTLELQLERELEAFVHKLEVETEPRAPRHSKFYHDRRRVEQQAKQTKRYQDAAIAKVEADRMQRLEEEEWRKKRVAKIATLQRPMQAKQDRERMALEQRVATTKEAFAKVRAEELEVLLRRGECVFSEIDQQQRIKALKVHSNPLVHSPFMLVSKSELEAQPGEQTMQAAAEFCGA